jgi:hypothetical protein
LAHDELPDRRKVPDEVCKGLDRLAGYEYRLAVLDDEIAAGAFQQESEPTRITRLAQNIQGDIVLLRSAGA